MVVRITEGESKGEISSPVFVLLQQDGRDISFYK